MRERLVFFKYYVLRLSILVFLTSTSCVPMMTKPSELSLQGQWISVGPLATAILHYPREGNKKLVLVHEDRGAQVFHIDEFKAYENRFSIRIKSKNGSHPETVEGLILGNQIRLMHPIGEDFPLWFVREEAAEQARKVAIEALKETK